MTTSYLYIAMAGLETATVNLSTVAQNLANANTQGYAAAATAAMAVPFQGTAAIPGADVIPLQESSNTAAGSFEKTGDPFDIAVKGGWLVAQAAGQQVLTRNGVLAQSAGGLLTTQTGEPLVGVDGAPISLPKLQKIEVSQDGTISGIPVGALIQQPQVYGQLMLADTPANGQLTPMGNSLYAIPGGGAPTPAANATVQQGYVEGSNVSSVSAMVDMLDTTRSFQLQTQIVQDGAKSETSLDQVLIGQ